MLDRIKAHVGRHKVVYSVGTIVVIAGVSYYIGTRVGLKVNIANNRAGIIFGDQTIKIITVVQRNGRGHPGYPVMNMITKEWWKSAKACADAEGISETLLAGNLQGKIPNVNGVPYSWISLVPTPIA